MGEAIREHTATDPTEEYLVLERFTSAARQMESASDISFYPLDEWGTKHYTVRNVSVSGEGFSFETERNARAGSLVILRMKKATTMHAEPHGQQQEGALVVAARVVSVSLTRTNSYLVTVEFDTQTYLAGL